MKQGKKKNDWTPHTRFMFLDDNYWRCWGCERCHANCGHHIFGRGKIEGPEKSPLNFAPLGNFECHLPRHGYWTTDEGKRHLFTKTINYLSAIGYTLSELDKQFLEKYEEELARLNINF
jgi:hypothetical protein